MPRLFWGLDLSPGTQHTLFQLAQPLHIQHGCKPEAAGKLHATLLFIGETDTVQLDALKRNAGGLELPQAIETEYTGIGYFTHYNGGVIWAGFAHRPEIDDVLRGIYSVTRVSGIQFSIRDFKPHITLLRCKVNPAEVLKRAEITPKEAFPIVFGSFSLYSSVLKPGGSVYRKELTISASKEVS